MFWMKLPSIGSYIWLLGTQLMKMFGKDEERLVLLREVCHWGCIKGFRGSCHYKLSLPVPCCGSVRWDATSQLLLKPHACLPTAIPSTILSWLSSWNQANPQLNSFFIMEGGKEKRRGVRKKNKILGVMKLEGLLSIWIFSSHNVLFTGVFCQKRDVEYLSRSINYYSLLQGV